MRVSFILEPDDLRRVWQWARIPSWTIAISMVSVFLLMTGALGYFNHDYLFGAWLAFLLSPAILASNVLQNRRRGERSVASALAQQPNLIGPRTLALGRDGVCDVRESGTEIYPWGQVRGFCRHSRYVLIRVDNVGVVPVPLRAFPSRRDAEEFWAALLAYKMSENTASGPAPLDETVWPPPPRVA